MAEKKVLRIRDRNEEFVDVEINVDECTILDVYLDMFKLSGSNPRFLLPTRACIAYDSCIEGDEWTRNFVHNDNDLMKMLNYFKDENLIQIFLGSSETPSEGMVLARRLHMGKNSPFVSGLTTSPPKQDPKPSETSKNPKPSRVKNLISSNITPRRSPRKRVGTPSEQPVQPPPSPQFEVHISDAPPLDHPPPLQHVESHVGAIPEAPPADPPSSPPPTGTGIRPVHPTGLPVRNGKKLAPSTARGLGLPFARVSSSTAGRERRARSTRSMTGPSVDEDDILSSDNNDISYEPVASDDDEDGGTDIELEDEGSHNSHSADDHIFVDEHPEKSSWDDLDETELSRVYRNGILYEDPEDGVIELEPWLLFQDKAHFMEVFVDYCVQQGFSVVTLWSDTKRYAVECASEHCSWRLAASRLVDDVTWAIKNISAEPHSCSRLQGHNPMASVEWAVRQLMGDVRANPDLTATALNNILFERFGIKLKRSSLYNMREEVLKRVEGSHDDSYALLPAYCDVLKATNSGSIAEFASKTSSVIARQPIMLFHNIFVALHACIVGVVRGARPLIGVDGTHLKGHYGGVLLTAVAIDGNNEIFPLAYAIVQSETKQTWRLFFTRLKDLLAPSGRQHWTIICDRQKGVEPALTEIWPTAERRFCCRHLLMNFRKKFTGPKLYTCFWRIANAYSEFTFRKGMEAADKAAEDVKKHKPGTVVKDRVSKWFRKQGPTSSWSRHAYNPVVCSDTNTSNFVESFNASLGKSRNKPVLSMLEDLRRMCMERHCSRVEEAERWDPNGLTPYATHKLRVADKDSKCCKVYKSSDGEFEIRDGKSCLPVSINEMTCACGVWQISGIPCKHAVRALNHMRVSLKDYVSPYYSVKTYKIMYGLPIKPIPDPDQWNIQEQADIRPPALKRGVGRPARNRKRESGEKRKAKRSSTVKCGKCKQIGHNARTCKGGLTAREQRNLAAGEGPSSPHEDNASSCGDDFDDAGSADDAAIALDYNVISSAPWRNGSQTTPP